jgi:hypothetical protein
MKGQHDAKDGAQEPDVGSIGGDRADHDQSSRQSDLKYLLVRKLLQIYPPVEQPTFYSHGDTPDTQDEKKPNNSEIHGMFQAVHVNCPAI